MSTSQRIVPSALLRSRGNVGKKPTSTQEASPAQERQQPQQKQQQQQQQQQKVLTPAPSSSPKAAPSAVKAEVDADLSAAQMSLFALRGLLQEQQMQQQQQLLVQQQQMLLHQQYEQQQQRQMMQQQQQQQQQQHGYLGDSVMALKGLLNMNGGAPAASASIPPTPEASNKVQDLLRAAMQKRQQEAQRQLEQQQFEQRELDQKERASADLKGLLLRAARQKQEQKQELQQTPAPAPTTYSSILKKDAKPKPKPAPAPSVVPAPAPGPAAAPAKASASPAKSKSKAAATSGPVSILPDKVDLSKMTAEQIRKAEKLAKEMMSAKRQQPQQQNVAAQKYPSGSGAQVDRFAGSAFLSSPDPNDMPLPTFEDF